LPLKKNQDKLNKIGFIYPKKGGETDILQGF